MEFHGRFIQKEDLANITFEERGEVPVEFLKQTYQQFLIVKKCTVKCDIADTIQKDQLLEINNFDDYLNKTSDKAIITEKANKNIAHIGKAIKRAEFWQNLVSYINFGFQFISAAYAFITLIVSTNSRSKNKP